MRYEDRIKRRGGEGSRTAIGTGRFGIFPLAFLFCALVAPAFALDFNANWDYRQSGGEGVPTMNEFRQRYNLGVGSTLTLRPTHAFSASAGMSYTRSHGRDSEGSTDRDRLSPYAQMSLVNDIFTAQLSGTTDVSTPDDHRSSATSSWNGSLGSGWDMPLWPRVRLNYGEQTVEAENGEDFPARTNTNSGISLDWDLLLAQVNYQYNTSGMEVEGSDMSTESNSHFVGFETGGTFWRDKLRFHLTQNYTQSDQEVYSGNADAKILLRGEISSGVTDPAESLDLLPGESWTLEEIDLSLGLGAESEDDFSQGLTVESGERVHLVFDHGVGQALRQVDLLRLTLDPLTIPSEAQVAELQWNLYLKSAAGWELVQGGLTATYSADRRRIELEIGSSEQEIMIAAVNRTGIPLTITGFDALRRFTAEGETSRSSSVSTLTNFSLGYRITRHLTASGSLILNRSDYNDGDQENERQTVSGSLRYTANPLLVPSVSYSESRQEQTGREETLGRSYAFVLSAKPLPKATLSFGVTLGTQYLGSRKMSTSTRYTLSSRAAIYPDLSAAALISYGQSESRREEEMVGQDSFSGRLNLHARLRQNVTADLTSTYFQNMPEQGRSLQGGEIRTGLRYRPSDVLSLRGAYTTYYGDDVRPESLNLGATLSLLNTNKTRLTFTASHYQQENSRQNLSLLWNWKISRSLTFWSRANYMIADTKVYSFQLNLSLKL